MTDDTDRPSTRRLLQDAFEQGSGLAWTQLRLLRAEMGEKASLAMRAAALAAVAAALGLGGVIVLLEAAVSGLTALGWPAPLAGLAIALAALDRPPLSGPDGMLVH